ncbi:MAG: pyrroline-5-carboxylate reductase [Dehalococcoidia bacterium]|nr:pyrroline-5-carboxylate reductase [Dehalococcoidia bacterium]
MKVAFVGGGVMAEAILSSLLSKKIAGPRDITVGEPIEARRSQLSQQYGIATSQSNAQVCAGADMVVFSIKPQSLGAVLKELRGVLKPTQAVLSIMAGITTGQIVQGLNHQAVVRVIPNTPAQVGAGMSVWTATPEITSQQREAAKQLLAALGEEVYVPEEKYIDMATALSSSGVAFVLAFAEAMMDGGVHVGMSRDMAQSLTYQTIAGTIELARKMQKHPAELRNMVSSPGGTTVEGLLALEEGAFRADVVNAIIAAFEKSKALAEKA